MTQSESTDELSKLKTAPHSIEAEQSVLGALMMDNSQWDNIATHLIADEFYRPEHQLIYRQMGKLSAASQPFDVITLGEALEQSGELDQVGGVQYVNDLAENTASITNLRAYAQIVSQRAILRKLIKAATDIAEQAYDPQGRQVEELVDEAERMVFQIAEDRPSDGGAEDVNTLLARAVERIDVLFNSTSPITGLSTGFTKLDEYTSGFQPGDLIILAARPSMGKTAFAMNLVESAVMGADKPCVVFSLEMPADQLISRMLSSVGRINASRVRDGKLEDEDWQRLSSAVNMLQDKKLYIDDTAGISPTEMRARMRRIAREHGEIGMVMIDYLQLMNIKGFTEGRTAEISEISRSLKAIGKEFGCPVVALSQLNRGVEQRPNKRPVNSDLRESGAIEQDADLILFLYRDEYYNPDNSEKKGIGEVIIGKNRNGEVGNFDLAFIGKYTRFEDLAPEFGDGFE